MSNNKSPDNTKQIRKWWGNYKTKSNTYTFFKIGPLQLWINRLNDTWEIGQKQDADPLASELAHEFINPNDVLNPVTWTRYGIRGKNPEFSLIPVTADRPVVSRLNEPYFLPPREKTTLYIGTPLWFRMKSLNPDKIMLEQTFYRPSDTWFGPTTNEGELCYASITPGRTLLEDIQYCPHRAITTVVFINKTNNVHKIESFKLPVVNFSLFQGSENHLWTQDVVFELSGDNEFAKMAIKKDPPAILSRANKVAGPREEAYGSISLRVLSMISR
ncbi:MAG: hypothetical protein PF689_00665 [Deltaproteobacteria bacterium]|jgi:hypothetical protein|nr:hypothetical protein [Deltaproteobacteria bacterium]